MPCGRRWGSWSCEDRECNQQHKSFRGEYSQSAQDTDVSGEWDEGGVSNNVVALVSPHKFPLLPLVIEAKQNIAKPVVPFDDQRTGLERTIEIATFSGVREVCKFHEIEDHEMVCQSYGCWC